MWQDLFRDLASLGRCIAEGRAPCAQLWPVQRAPLRPDRGTGVAEHATSEVRLPGCGAKRAAKRTRDTVPRSSALG
jgi:hypothetical protein